MTAVANDNAMGVEGGESDRTSTVKGDMQAQSGTTMIIVPPIPSRQAVQHHERAPDEILEEGRPAHVQHVGSWVLLALLGMLGIHEEAAKWSSGGSRVASAAPYN